MVKVKYVDGTEEHIEAWVDPDTGSAFCFDKSSNSFVVYTSDDLRDDIFINRDMVKEIYYIHVE